MSDSEPARGAPQKSVARRARFISHSYAIAYIPKSRAARLLARHYRRATFVKLLYEFLIRIGPRYEHRLHF